jgi:hypothetical protein
MKFWDYWRRNGRWIECLLALFMLFCGIKMVVDALQLQYLPQPFFYDTDDTFRDWFSTAIWAHEQGAYDTWLTVYPPLSFVILKVVGTPSCYEYAPWQTVRDCDWGGMLALHVIYVINAVIVSIYFMKIDRRTALPRAFAITAGMPMLFGLERGNIILLAFTFMMFAYGPLLKSARWRIFFIGLSVNMKVYLISGVLIHLVKRRWLWTELAVISIVMVYIVSYLLFGDGTPKQIVDNLINFATGAKASQLLDFWYPNTYVALRYVLGESDAPMNNFLGSDQVNQILLAMTWSTRTAQAVILAATAATWFRPELVPTYRLTLLGLSFAMITTETSAYTQPLLFLFVFMEPWKGWLRPMAISSVYLLCLPGDIGLGSSGAFHEFSYLWQRYVTADRFLAVGMFTRPLILMLPSTFLGLHTILVVAKDIRDHGWRSPWRYAMPGLPAPAPVSAGA